MGISNFFRKVFGGRAPEADPKPAQDGPSSVPPKVSENRPEAKAQSHQPNSESRFQPPPVVKRKSRDLVIGLDFGTSCSKIVIGDNLSGSHYAVPAENSDLTESAYLHGGILYKSTTLGYSLTAPTVGLKIRTIKMRLIKGDVAAESDSTIYLTLLVRRAITWFTTTHEEDYRNVDICWQLNVGLPAKDATDSALTDKYNRIAQTALVLALENSDSIQLDRTKHLLDPRNRSELAHVVSRVRVYPEVAAELEAFRRAVFFQRGNYLLADVGAGTLDIATFAIGNGADAFGRFVFHAMDVAQLGAFKLHEARLNELRAVGLRAKSTVTMEDMAYRIPDNPRDYLEGEAVTRQNLLFHLEEADRKFGKEAVNSIVSVAMATHINLRRTQRQQLSPFRNGINLFLCGGGAKLQFFQQLIEEVEAQLRDYLAWGPGAQINLHRLPFPRNLIALGLAPDEYDRIAVAYGLSFPAMDLPEIQVGDLKVEVAKAKRSGVAISAAQLDQILHDIYHPKPSPNFTEVPLQRPVTIARLASTKAFAGIPESQIKSRFESCTGRSFATNDILPDSIVIEEFAARRWRPRFE